MWREKRGGGGLGMGERRERVLEREEEQEESRMDIAWDGRLRGGRFIRWEGFEEAGDTGVVFKDYLN